MSLAATHGAMALKRAALASFIREALGAHDALYLEPNRVEQYVRLGTLEGRDREDRIAVMGEPVRYARCVYEGEDRSGAQSYVDGTGRPGHRFAVQVYFQHDEPNDSQADFDELTEGTDEATPGLLPLLWSTPALSVAGIGVVRLDAPADVVAALAPLDVDTREFVHFVEFTLTAF